MLLPLHVVCLAALAGDMPAPHLCVPRCTTEVTLDGVPHDAEWADAAVVRRLWRPGNQVGAEPRTAFHVKHDGAALLIAATCAEPEEGYPKAFPRSPTDDLSDDDAVQVVLGVADEAIVDRGALQMGGYPEAQGTPVAAADHYYQFTLNAAGARSRTYNEGPLDRPLFEGRVHIGDGAWTAELRIPFASAGIDRPVGRVLKLNLFRFRPPDMFAWHIPAFGGYAPMPFGELELLPDGESVRRTMEEELSPTPPAFPPPLRTDLEWYPLSRRLVGEVEGATAPAAEVVLRTSDGVERRSRLRSAAVQRVFLDYTPDDRLPASAELLVLSTDGRELERKTTSLTTQPRPDWMDTTAGTEYADDAVPEPWSAAVVTGEEVRLLAQTLRFGGGGLPDAIECLGEELLAGPAEVVLSIDRRLVTPSPGTCHIHSRGARALVEGRQAFDGGIVETRSVVDYDGFAVCKLRVRGPEPGQVDGLSLRFPLRRDNARFVHRQLVQQVRQLTGFGWEGDAGPVWLGGYERGLAFSFDESPFPSSHRRSQVQVIEDGQRVWLQLNFVDAPGQVAEDGRIFSFYLLPTPTKPTSIRKTGLMHTGLWFEEWSDYQGYPDLAKLPEVQKRSRASHERGEPFILYFSQVLAENSPGFAEFGREFLVPPGLMWYRRAYDPGRDVPCYVVCPRGPWGNLLLDGIEHLATEGDIDGVYMDGPSVPWECHSGAHRACSGEDRVTWAGDEETPLVATRQFLKRVRGIFDARRRARLAAGGQPPRIQMVAHHGGAVIPEVLSLCDGYCEGEQLARYRPGYRLPLHKFVVGYTGHPWGWRTDLLPGVYAGRQMMAWSLLHDGEMGGANAELEQRIYGDFSDGDTVEYYPYWRPQPRIRLREGDVLFSYYRKPDATMLIASNLTWRGQHVELDVSDLYDDEVRSAVDVARDQAVPVHDGRLSIDLGRHHFAALRLSCAPAAPDTGPPAAGPIPVATGYDSADWSISRSAAGVKVQEPYAFPGGQQGVRLESTMYADYASAELAAGLLGEEATVRLLLQRNARLDIMLGEVCLKAIDDRNWQLLGAEPTTTGRFYSPPARPDEPEELAISFDHGRLDAVLGDRPLARDIELYDSAARRPLTIRTWGGDWFAFTALSITNRPTRLFLDDGRHPVL